MNTLQTLFLTVILLPSCNDKTVEVKKAETTVISQNLDKELKLKYYRTVKLEQLKTEESLKQSLSILREIAADYPNWNSDLINHRVKVIEYKLKTVADR